MGILLDAAAILMVGFTALTLVQAAVRNLSSREIDLPAQGRMVAASAATIAAYVLLMKLGLTTKAIAGGAAAGLALGYAAAHVAGHEEDEGTIIAAGSSLFLVPWAASSIAAIVGGARPDDAILATGMLGLIVSCAIGAGQLGYYTVAKLGARRRQTVIEPVSPDVLDRLTFPESAFRCTNGHPISEPSYEFCLTCGGAVVPVPVDFAAPPAEETAPVALRVCGACGASVGHTAKFCFTCGRPLSEGAAAVLQPVIGERTCGGCGAHLAAGDRFCAACGVRAA
jgi:hypothetical protein